VGRGSQPWYYFLIVLSSYEFLAIFLLIIGLFQYKKLSSSLNKFLLFWLIFNLVIYGIASEKMPWLTINILIPIIFISGISLEKIIFSNIKNKNIHALIIVLIILFGIVTLKVSIDSSFNKPDYPDEIMVYTQTSSNVHNLIQKIILHSDENDSLSIAIDTSEGFTWPWAWYLRNYNVTYINLSADKGLTNNEFENFDFIILNTKFDDVFLEKIDTNEFNIINLPFRQWYPENYRLNSLNEFVKYIPLPYLVPCLALIVKAKSSSNISFIFSFDVP
jgi:predicted membrane-bound mannosyltransferase